VTDPEVICVTALPDGDFDVKINPGPIMELRPDPAIWGISLADLVQHITNAIEGRIGTDSGVMSREAIFKRIEEVMLVELRTNREHAKRKTDA
jgi:hypothetical protein